MCVCEGGGERGGGKCYQDDNLILLPSVSTLLSPIVAFSGTIQYNSSLLCNTLS